MRVMSYGATDRAGWRRVDWAYDALGRRIRQTSYMLSNGVWVVTEDLKFVSDPVWFGRHLAELNATNHALVRSYVWGLDLSETLDGAGGVGGLLWIRMASGPASGTHFVTYDGNGNVWQLVSASTGTETARYEYGPFGEPLRASGPQAANPFRFSTKYQDDETGLLYYGHRYYAPSTGRWPNRDPLGELGGVNLYGFVANDPITTIDALGLKQYKIWASAFIMPATITFPHTFNTAPFIDLFATWAGNGRGFGPGPLAPWYSKMAHEVVIETSPVKPPVVSNGSVGGSSAVWYMTWAGPAFATGVSPAPALATVTRPSRCITKVVINGSVRNPLEPLAPSIDYSYTFVLDSLKGRGRLQRSPRPLSVARTLRERRFLGDRSPAWADLHTSGFNFQPHDFAGMVWHSQRVLQDAMIRNALSIPVFCALALLQSGCGRKSEKDIHSESKMMFNSSEWNKAAAEDISVRIISVFHRPAANLSWINEHDLPQLTAEEQEAIAKHGVTGQMEVVYSTARGSGSKEVRVVINQTGPLTANARLAVPKSGSAIFIHETGELKPLFTNSPPSALILEIFQEKKETTFFLDYPRDRVRSGGAMFWWDEDGHFHEI